jgi:hypothetical protein
MRADICSRHWWLCALAVAVTLLQAIGQPSAQTRPLAPSNVARTPPNVVHPGRFVGPDSVRFPTRPIPIIVVDIDPTAGMATAQQRARRKQIGTPK